MATDIFCKAKCTYCLEEVIGVRIKCAECPDFDLCLQCFSAGAEIGLHKSNHAYQFVDTDSLDIFKSKGGWSAREELALLKGIEVLGFGNWEDISNFINKNKTNGAIRTPSECQEEYMATFVEGSIGRLTWPWALERRGRLTDVTKDFSVDSDANRPPKFTPMDVTFEQALELGYTPKIDHFEKEYENDAETLVSHLNISGTQDDELDVALKLAQVDMYCTKLRERMRRKRVARDYQLVTKFFNSLLQRPRYPSHDRQPELEENLKFLTQYLTATEFDSLLSSYGRQLSLRRRAAELARYRMNGLTRFEEIPHFEQESSSKEKPPNSASRRKHRRRMRFHRQKQHAPHRAPHLIAAARAAARAAGLIH